ncbi:MAG: hemolysin XhlA family protein [Gorillibacterium sp.]|nr:hemolysin XhlA family protein [Gorillibacterium sp.]
MPDETNEILQRLTRVETKLDIMNSARDIALEAIQSSKSAHLRIDEMRDELAQMKAKQGENQRWLVGTIISSVGLFITAVGLLLKAMSG